MKLKLFLSRLLCVAACLLFSFSVASSVVNASSVPASTVTVTLTYEQMVALLYGSEWTITAVPAGSQSVEKFEVTPIILNPVNYSYETVSELFSENGCVFLAFPVDISDINIYTFGVNADFPFNFSGVSSVDISYMFYSLGVESVNFPLYKGYATSFSLKTVDPFVSYDSGLFSIPSDYREISFMSVDMEPGNYRAGIAAVDFRPMFYDFGTYSLKYLDTDKPTTISLGDYYDFTSMSMSYTNSYATGVPSGLTGIGIWFYPFTITYKNNGPDYSDMLNQIYDELVRQGQITQQGIQDIIDNQNKNTQDIIDNQDKNTQDLIDHDQQLWDDTFNPSDDAVSDLGNDIFNEDLQNELMEKLGLFTFIDDVLIDLLDVLESDNDQTSLRFPGLSITIAGTDYQVIDPYDFDIADSLSEFGFLVSAIKFVTGVIFILAFLGYLHRLKERFLYCG